MKVYADTSTIGGCFDEEFKEYSNALLNEFVSGKKILMFSDLTAQELELARQEIKEKVREIPVSHRVDIGMTDEAIKLAETYI